MAKESSPKETVAKVKTPKVESSEQTNPVEEIVKKLDECFRALNGKLCSICNDKCCKHCVAFNAYFNHPSVSGRYGDPKYIERFRATPKAMGLLSELRVKYGWDHEKGFLRPHGCALPRKEMSVLCQRAVCRAMLPEFGDTKELNTWLDELTEIRRKAGSLI